MPGLAAVSRRQLHQLGKKSSGLDVDNSADVSCARANYRGGGFQRARTEDLSTGKSDRLLSVDWNRTSRARDGRCKQINFYMLEVGMRNYLGARK
jgi:hypothetical protein